MDNRGDDIFDYGDFLKLGRVPNVSGGGLSPEGGIERVPEWRVAIHLDGDRSKTEGGSYLPIVPPLQSWLEPLVSQAVHHRNF